jgi:hypothetical protein
MPQGNLAIIVGVIALAAVWFVIMLALASEKRHQSKNPDEH